MRPWSVAAVLAVLLCTPGCGSPSRDTPLTAAAAAGDITALHRELHRGADPEEPDSGGWTPLVWAARGGHGDVLQALLEAGADPGAVDSYVNGWSPLMHAIHKGQEGAVRTLLRAGADPGATGGSPLRMAAGYAQAEIVRLLLAAGADPRGGPPGAILASAVGGALDIDYRWRGCAAHQEVVDLLLEHAPDLRLPGGLRGRRAVWSARRHGCHDLLRGLPGR